jgi:hypothetical protein
MIVSFLSLFFRNVRGVTSLGKFCLLFFQAWSADVMAFNSCEKDYKGQLFCAYPGGVAIKTPEGVVCGKGACERDLTGKFVCSNTSNGGVSKNSTRKIFCFGECETPKPEYCIKFY